MCLYDNWRLASKGFKASTAIHNHTHVISHSRTAFPCYSPANVVGICNNLSHHSFQWKIKYLQSQADNIFTGVLHISCSHGCSFIRGLYSGYWQYPLPAVGPCHCQPYTRPETPSVLRGIHARKAQEPKTHSEYRAALGRIASLYPFCLEHLQQTPILAFGYDY